MREVLGPGSDIREEGVGDEGRRPEVTQSGLMGPNSGGTRAEGPK